MGRYHIVTTWRVSGTVEEVAAILGDVAALPRWWPSVYLAVEEREPGDARGVGKVVALRTKGWLPYTLGWEFRVTEVDLGAGPDPGGRVVLESQGDFAGRGEWWLWQEGTPGDPITVARYGLGRGGAKAPPAGADAGAAPAPGREPRLGDAARRGEPAPGSGPAPRRHRG